MTAEAPRSFESAHRFAIVAFTVTAGLIAALQSPDAVAQHSRSVPVATALPPHRPAELSSKPVPDARKSTAEPSATPPAGHGDIQGPPIPTDVGCLASLIAAGHRFRKASPDTRDAACLVIDPVVVEGLMLAGSEGKRTIMLDPPPVLSCAMAGAVAHWLETSVQPLSQGEFQRDLATLRVGGGHECRRRNHSARGPLSEHATGQALDIFAFGLGVGKDGIEIVVEKPEGPDQVRFLDAVRQSACGAFMTSLGPGSDAAHANHLHVDIQPRRSPASRYCQ